VRILLVVQIQYWWISSVPLFSYIVNGNADAAQLRRPELEGIE